MKLDEAIAHAIEVAKDNREKCTQGNGNQFSKCLKCAEEHEQLAKWLKEVQQYRALGTVEKVKEYKEIVDNIRATDMATLCIALNELRKYQDIGTAEEIQNMKKEEDILKFYYCESKDEYYIGKRVDTMYYAKYSPTGFTWFMSRNLPWGEHVVAPNTLWKEHTYPSEPKEISFFEWLQGFMKKECLGTVEECRTAVEKQRAKEPIEDRHHGIRYTEVYHCSVCGNSFSGRGFAKYCYHCGQAIDWE